jgi:dipeptidyl aminopeptidase/acylaminoacyl peptidase
VEGAASLTDTWEEGSTVWWSELRPTEGGRVQIVRRDPDGSCTDLLPEGFSARNRVHEYGGGAWWVGSGVVYFTNWDDQRLYRLERDGEPLAITPEPPEPHSWRYADGRVTPDGSCIVCVREDHTGNGEARNEIVGIPVDGSSTPVVLISGRDFVAAPRPSPDGRQLAWIAWDHPNMPWDNTELWIAHMDARHGIISVDGAHWVAGGDDESLTQPEWGRHGILYVISDRSNWWNVYKVEGVDALTPVFEIGAEIGGPAWVFGLSAYGFTKPQGHLVAAWTEHGRARIGRIDPMGGELQAWILPYVSLSSVRIAGQHIVAIAHSTDHEPEVVRLSTVGSHAQQEVLRKSRDLGLDPEGISRAEPIAFASAGGRTAHAYFYPPTSATIEAPEDELPPLIVASHGGPTSSASPAFSLGIQYWTSRGFAFVDVDYGGSTGYGREYRSLLNGRWGIVDVEDCCAAAEHLVAKGLVDGNRLAIRGGSAGGFTTLAALAFNDTFKAGANHFGVSDMSALAAETHKFESRYLDNLVGPWPSAKAVYDERSPINHVGGFDVPLITFQGLEDAIVLPNQSERISNALDERNIPHAYLAFEGEQHGFRKSETIKAVLDAELSFYGQVFGFEPVGVNQPVALRHADKL